MYTSEEAQRIVNSMSEEERRIADMFLMESPLVNPRRHGKMGLVVEAAVPVLLRGKNVEVYSTGSSEEWQNRLKSLVQARLDGLPTDVPLGKLIFTNTGPSKETKKMESEILKKLSEEVLEEMRLNRILEETLDDYTAQDDAEG